MPRPKSKLNQETSEVIERNILQDNPEGLGEIKVSPVAIAKQMPKMERIIFRNDRDPGVCLEFHYHSATHYLHHYKLFHGEEYTLPVEIIDHLEDRKVPFYEYRKDPAGHLKMHVIGYKYMFSCKRVRDRHAA